MSLYVQIGRTDGTGKVNYGPSGNNTVSALNVEVSGPFAVGSASLEIHDYATGFDIRSRDMVQIYESTDAGVTISNRIFLGFVEETEQQVMATRSTYVKWLVKCQDANILWDWHRFQVITGTGATDGGLLDFDGQLQRISRVVATNNFAGSPVWDDVSGMALTANLTTDITFNYKGLSMRDMFTKRMSAYQASYPTSRPRFFMGYQTTGGASVFLPMMNVYDETTLLAAAAKYTFSTSPAGTDKTIIANTLKRTRQGNNLTTSVQATSFTNGGTNRQRANSANITTYPNYFDQRPLGGGATPLKAWDGPLLKVEDGATNAQCLNIATEEISVSENPAEVFTFQCDDTLATGLLPGDTIAITATAELGLTAYKRVVSNVEIEYIPQGSTFIVRRTITAGNQLLELGDDDRRQTSPVQEGDHVPPEAPTSLAVQYITDSTISILQATWVSSVSADVNFIRLHFTINGGHYTRETTRDVGSGPPTSYNEVLNSGDTGSVYITAVDHNGNESDATASVAIVGNGGTIPPPNDRILNGDFLQLDISDTTQPRFWTKATTASGTAVVATDKAIKGAYSLKMHVTASALSEVIMTSAKVATLNTAAGGATNQYALAWRVGYHSTAATGTLTISLKYYDSAGAVLSTVVVFTGTPTVSYNVKQGSRVPPAGAVSTALVIDYGSTGTANDLWISGCRLEDALVAAAFAPIVEMTSDTYIKGGANQITDTGVKQIGDGGPGTQNTEYYLDDGVTLLGFLRVDDGGSPTPEIQFGATASGGVLDLAANGKVQLSAGTTLNIDAADGVDIGNATGGVFPLMRFNVTGASITKPYIEAYDALGATVFGVDETGAAIFKDVSVLSGVIFTQTADAYIANDNTELTLVGAGVGTMTLPADFLIEGRTIRVKGRGFYQSLTGAEQMYLGLIIGGTHIVSTDTSGWGNWDTIIGAAGNPSMFAFEVDVTCRTTGAGGTVQPQGEARFKTDINGSSLTVLEAELIGSGGAITLDTTVSNLIDVVWSWKQPDPANAVTLTNLTVEILN